MGDKARAAVTHLCDKAQADRSRATRTETTQSPADSSGPRPETKPGPASRFSRPDKIVTEVRPMSSEKRPKSTHWQARATIAQDTGKALPDVESGGDPRQGDASG